jgi:hypothetical protein
LRAVESVFEAVQVQLEEALILLEVEVKEEAE